MIADAPGARAVRLRNDAGQRLRARDLQDEYDLQTWRRAVHVVALHDTWGIAIGFAASLGAGEAILGPGLAYDCFGREIILSRDRHVPSPILPDAGEAIGSLTLVARYDPGLAARRPDPDAFPCTDRGERLGREGPLLAWRRRGQVRLGLEVPLLAARPSANGLIELDLGVRHYARAQARPHIAAGATERTQPWEPWQVGVGDTKRRLGVQTRVVTADAGFVGQPYYLASLRTTPAALLAIGRHILLPSIVDPGADGFTFRVAQTHQLGDEFPPPPVNPTALRIDWLGIEPAGGCVPLAQPQFVLEQLLLRRSVVTELAVHFAALGGVLAENPGG